jgi:hypothetical protein
MPARNLRAEHRGRLRDDGCIRLVGHAQYHASAP